MAEIAGERQEAQRLFQEGRRLYNRGDYPAALLQFQAAAELTQSYKIDLSIAFTLYKLGQLAAAAQVFERTLLDRPDGLEQQAEQMAVEHLRRVRRVLATVAVDGQLDGAVVEIDGDSRHPLPLRHRLYLEPGRHRLSVVRAGRVVQSTQVTLEAGQHFVLHLSRPIASPGQGQPWGAQAEAPPPRAAPFYKTWWFWTAVGVVAAGTAVGIAAGVSSGGDSWLPRGDSGTIDLRQDEAR